MVALMELTTKLQAVMDDQDAIDLLAHSRQTELAKIHPNMSMVDRVHSFEDAKWYITQGKPVVITAQAAGANINSNPVATKWTMEYLHRKIFATASAESGYFNVATDRQHSCCRYFEPQGKAKSRGYPYPFAPTTHLYRDTFNGFLKTIRKSSRNNNAGAQKKKKPNNRMLHYLHEILMNGQGEAVVAGDTKAPSTQLRADLTSIQSLLQPMAQLQPFWGGFASAKVWIGQQGIVMPMHYDSTDNLYVMAYGRKRAIIGPPGQLLSALSLQQQQQQQEDRPSSAGGSMYRYPNGHPLVGSSQVNMSSPDLEKFPNFRYAQLQEVIVGPGDILYLPGWWWHQFEQPFEDTAALNLWSKHGGDESSSAGGNSQHDPTLHDHRVQEHALLDQIENAVVQMFGNQSGLVLDALANHEEDLVDATTTTTRITPQQLANAKRGMKGAAEAWLNWVQQLPGGHPKAVRSSSSSGTTTAAAAISADQLVAEFLETQKHVMPTSKTRPLVEEERREEEKEKETGKDMGPFPNSCPTS